LAAEPITVVAAENFYGDVAQQIGGSSVKVTSILGNPDQDPHLFEASPSVARKISVAQIVIYNGIDYDPWIEKLLGAAHSSDRKAIVVADLVGRKQGDNPHIWYDLAAVLALVSRVAVGRVGVSARFGDLRDTARALHQARVTLRGRGDPGSPVSVFDGSILATAAVSAPEVMVDLASPVMQCFADLADEEREILFETFRVWLEHDGSMRTVGELLFCHANTVRYRMHRIEQRTGRSLSRPRDVAELCLAFEVHRRLM